MYLPEIPENEVAVSQEHQPLAASPEDSDEASDHQEKSAPPQERRERIEFPEEAFRPSQGPLLNLREENEKHEEDHRQPGVPRIEREMMYRPISPRWKKRRVSMVSDDDYGEGRDNPCKVVFFHNTPDAIIRS